MGNTTENCIQRARASSHARTKPLPAQESRDTQEKQQPNERTNERASKLTHTRFPRHTSGDNDDLSAREGLLETIIGGEVPLDFGGSGDMREVGGDAGGVDDIE